MNPSPRLYRLALASVMIGIAIALISSPASAEDDSATASVCNQFTKDQKLPAITAHLVAEDCRRNPARFVQHFNGTTFNSNPQSSGVHASVVSQPSICRRCTTFCETTTFAKTHDWTADLGAGMNPAQCMQVAERHCRLAYQSTLVGASCQTR